MMLRPALLAIATTTLSCGVLESDAGEVIAGHCEQADSDPDVEVSYLQQIQPRLQMGCGCHNPIPPASGVAIDTTGFSVGSYDSVRRGGNNSGDKIVIPGDPCGSFLYQKLSDAPPTGVRMPVSGPYWSRSDMALLHDWIAEGARDN